jgi:two-component system, chemotaxis family, chemotaxis protein CheY
MQALVIDDSAVTRSIAKSILKGMGFEVIEAGNGREGLVQLKGLGKADLVLVDWNMPEMDGIEFIRVIRAHHEYDALPLLMVTTNAKVEDVAAALNAGANEYIMKPFTEEIIREKLALLGFFQS